MSDLVRRVTLDRYQNKKVLPEFSTGDTIGVYVKVKEGEKERIQLFSGVVLKVQNSGTGRSFTVRKMSSGVGVERTFPLLSPAIDRIEVISRGKVRRSRLFYLRKLRGRSARLESETYFAENDKAAGEAAAPEKTEAKS
jgi:large subunit ribosomal protein L19